MMETQAADPRHESPYLHRDASLPRTVRVDARLTLQLAVLLALVAGSLLAWLGHAYHRIETEHEQALIRADNERILRLASVTMSESLAQVMSDLRYLSHDNKLADFTQRQNDAAAQNLAQEYKVFLSHKRDYDQLRILDTQGMERIRVNRTPGGASITPAGQLQDKHLRYYFQAMTALPAGAIYVSPLDLNVEHGQVETPWKPMIRFGMALIGQDGQRRGYIVINYLAAHLLAKLRTLANGGHALWLLDARGDWLLGPDVDVWSGQLPQRHRLSFVKLYPDAWAAMQRQEAGRVLLQEAQLQYLRVLPLHTMPSAQDAVQLAMPTAASSYAWYLLSMTTPQAGAASHAPFAALASKSAIALVLLTLLMSSGLAYAIARQRSLAHALGRAVDNLPVLVAYIDAGQRYRFNNRAYLNTFGLTPKDLYGRHVRDLLGEAAYQEVRLHLEKALAGEYTEFEVRLDIASRPRDLMVSYVPDVTSRGRVHGVYALITDISRRKAAEQREREHMRHLARISRLASLGETTTEIAHQINQPLAAISMFSNAAQRSLANGDNLDKLPEWLQAINAQAKRAAEVVQRLRRFAFRGDMTAVPLDLNAAAREALALTEAEARARQVMVQAQLAESLPPVLASDIHMQQVIYNMVHNAILAAAAQDQTGQVTLRTHADGGRVWLEVLDNAATPDESDHEAGGAAKSGIGLALSRSIVTSYDGDLTSQRLETGGNRIALSLPMIST